MRALSLAEHVPELVDLCVIDVSFISLTLVLPNAFDLITPTGVILALIKPQFELQRADVGRGGVVRDHGAAPKGPGQDSRVRYTFTPCGDRNCSICYHRRRRQPGIFCMHPKTIGIIAHTGKPGVGDLVNAIAEEFSDLSDHSFAGKRNSARCWKEIRLLHRRTRCRGGSSRRRRGRRQRFCV